VEEEYELGGHLRWSGASPDVLRQLRAAVAAAPNVEVMANSTVTGCYDDNWIAIAQRDHPGVDERLIKARAKVLVAAPGLIERPYVFSGNDKPGVMLSSAVQRLVNLYAVRPGRRHVFSRLSCQETFWPLVGLLATDRSMNYSPTAKPSGRRRLSGQRASLDNGARSRRQRR
jgi:hypothetical protein